MGLRGWWRDQRLSDPVAGTLQLTSCSAPPSGATYSNCHMQGVVTAPGVEPVATEHGCIAPISKWPQPGQTLPVRVDRADPTRLKVLWDEIPSAAQVGIEQAQQLAAQLSGAAGAGTGGQAAELTAAPGKPQPTGEAQQAELAAELQKLQSGVDDGLLEAQKATGHTTGVLGDPSRPVPGTAGGGLTVEQSAAAVSGNAAAAGLQAATARVLAVHEVPIPAGMPFGPPAGLFDLTLDVTLGSGESYSTGTRIGFGTEKTRTRVATVGAELPVLVNPAARDQVAVDTGKLG